MTIQTRGALTSLAHQSSPGMVGMMKVFFSWAPLASASCLITSKVKVLVFFGYPSWNTLDFGWLKVVKQMWRMWI